MRYFKVGDRLRFMMPFKKWSAWYTITELQGDSVISECEGSRQNYHKHRLEELWKDNELDHIISKEVKEIEYELF